ncbi:MAG: amidohydrolase family protein [Hungatella sp.]|jgi:N-acyl-D-amino-acid deacylase|nr:amidohydrolase family protein [Hungatella sp.]
MAAIQGLTSFWRNLQLYMRKPESYRQWQQLLVSENGTVAIIIQSMQPSDIDAVARLPYSCVISDAIYAETDRPHPRMYGAFPHFLHDYGVMRKVLPIPEAIAKMTGIPAKRMKIKDRGFLKEGYRCDINIFDLNELKGQATYMNPTEYATGIRYCIINGKIAVRDDVVLNQSSGMLLKL